jgi:hypothetical protein
MEPALIDLTLLALMILWACGTLAGSAFWRPQL